MTEVEAWMNSLHNLYFFRENKKKSLKAGDDYLISCGVWFRSWVKSNHQYMGKFSRGQHLLGFEWP